MLFSPLVDLAMRVAPPRLAFRMELARLRRWRSIEAEWLLLPELVDPRRAAIDVGGNYGLYAGRLTELCANVHCIEPQPSLVAKLRRKLPRRVALYAVALSSQDGMAELRVPHNDDGRASLDPANPVGGEILRVPIRRLDDLVTDAVGFIKIDVEGHELAVLQGAPRILRVDRPTLLIESEAGHHPGAPLDLFAHLAMLGYDGWFLWRGERLPIGQFSLERHQPEDRTRGYANNFVFRPA